LTTPEGYGGREMDGGREWVGRGEEGEGRWKIEPPLQNPVYTPLRENNLRVAYN